MGDDSVSKILFIILVCVWTKPIIG